MDNMSCNIIQDMLPLYVDGVASQETAQMVEAHLADCQGCRKKCSDLKESMTIPMNNDERPLQRIRRSWNRKKVILVCSTVAIILAILCCGFFLMEEFVYLEEIAYNGGVYTQISGVTDTLPQGSMEVGYIHGISFYSTASPMIDFMATNLDEKYGGCPIYQDSNNKDILYLEDFSGFFIPFQYTEDIRK